MHGPCRGPCHDGLVDDRRDPRRPTIPTASGEFHEVVEGEEMVEFVLVNYLRMRT